ncbi:MAG TPA: Ppx/GppA phosphatase family protein [Gemmatimonadales bacterium]|nr:Ppx/GppA phosphatase family protein [Gemmatimonadales bacterium]
MATTLPHTTYRARRHPRSQPARRPGARVTQATAPRLAAVDIGTNSIRLVIAEVQPDGSYRVLDEDREMSRLGRGLYAAGRIGEAPFEQSLAALSRMKAIADGYGVTDLRAIATSAVREAANGSEFVREAWRRTRVRVEVVSGDEEARLAFRSVARHYELDGRRTAIVDIGGGSAEVILAAGGVVEQMFSLPLGAVRLTEQYGKSDPLRPKHWRALRRAIDAAIDEGIGKPAFAAEVMIGSGGTFTNLAEMAQAERDGRVSGARDYALSSAEVKRLVDRLRETPLEGRRRIPGLNPQRADIIVAGAAVVSRLARRLDTQRVLVNDRGVRDGVLLTMIDDLTGGARPRTAVPDRMDTVRRFARACRSNERHCEHVAKLAGLLFDALRDAYALPPAGRDILAAAALLHDIGYLIHHEQHHKHAYHLILNGDLRGFSAREIELIANVARYHRRAFPKRAHSNLARLDKGERRLVRRLSGILRVADGLDRTHGQLVTGFKCRVGDGWVRLRVTAASDPAIDLEDAKRKAALLERAFQTELSLAAAQK